MLHCLKYTQKLPISLQAGWEFFSSPYNLKTLTPEYLSFEIKSLSGNKIYAGQIIEYTIRPLANIPITWVTEITHVKEQEYFVDEQRFGPYQFWHHEHRFLEITGGIEIIDVIYYKMPLGFLGKMLNDIKVKSDLEKIFAFRKAKLDELFGIYII